MCWKWKSRTAKSEQKKQVEQNVSSTIVESAASSEIREFGSSIIHNASENHSVSLLGATTNAISVNPFYREFGGGDSRVVSEYRSPCTNWSITSGARLLSPSKINTAASSRFVASRRLPNLYKSQATPNSSSLRTVALKPSAVLSNIPKTTPSSTGSQVENVLSNPAVRPPGKLVSGVISKSVEKKGEVIKLEPGVVYIFSQEKFDQGREFRTGTDEDVRVLRQTFNGCFRMQTNVFKDLTVNEIKAEVRKIERTDYTKKSCIVIVILTHGTRNDIVCAKDSNYSIDDDILFPMLRNETLIHKPKIFIIQACKGDYATNQFVYSDSKKCLLNAPLQIAKLYSTFEGFVTCPGDSGSLLIQIFCEYLQKNCGQKTVVEVMNDTIKQIVTQYGEVPTITQNMTVPLKFEDYV